MTTLDRDLEELQGARCEMESTTEFWGISKEFIQEKNPLQSSRYWFESLLQQKTKPKTQFLPKDCVDTPNSSVGNTSNFL